MRAVAGNSHIVAAVNILYTKEKVAILLPLLQLLEVLALDWIPLYSGTGLALS